MEIFYYFLSKIFSSSSDQVERKVKSSILTRLRRAQLGQSRTKVSQEMTEECEHRLSLGPAEGPSTVKQSGSQSCPSSPGITRRWPDHRCTGCTVSTDCLYCRRRDKKWKNVFKSKTSR